MTLSRWVRTLALATLAIVAQGCGSTIRTFNIPQQDTTRRSLAAIHQIASRLPSAEYKLGPGDVIRIKVHGVESLEATVRIPESGALDFPLAGAVDATGRTAPEVAKAIAAKLRERFMNDPHVTVFVEEFNSYRVSVVGAVTSPGTVVLKKGGCSLIDALAEAGGLTDKAGSEVFVTKRDPAGKTFVRTVDLQRLLEEGDLAENPPLAPGDSVYVPEGGYVFVTGHVNNPGAYPLRRGMTALQAISTAGDFLNTASRRVSLVRRISPDVVEVRKLDLDAVAEGKEADIKLRNSDVLEAESSVWKVPVYGTLDFIKSVFGIGTSIR